MKKILLRDGSSRRVLKLLSLCLIINAACLGQTASKICKESDNKTDLSEKSKLEDVLNCATVHYSSLMSALVKFSEASTNTTADKKPFREAANLQDEISNSKQASNELKGIASTWRTGNKSSYADTLTSVLDGLSTPIARSSTLIGATLPSDETAAAQDLAATYKKARERLEQAKANEFKSEFQDVETQINNAKVAETAGKVQNSASKENQATCDDCSTNKTKDKKPKDNAALSAFRDARFSENEAVNRFTRQYGTEIRTIVGVEQTGSAGADSQQKLFFNLFTSRPFTLGWNNGATSPEPDDELGPHWRWFGDVRFSSAPVQSNTLSGLASSFNVGGNVVKLQQNQIAQTAEFLSGVGFRVGSFAKPFFRTTGDAEKISVNLVALGGAIGTLTSDNHPTIYMVPDPASPTYAQVINSFPGLVTKAADGSQSVAKYLGFNNPPRNQYFRQAYVGMRLISHDSCISHPDYPCLRSGARLDVTIGENEAVTGGSMRHPIMRFEAFYPLSTTKTGSLNDVVYFFASAYLQITNPKPQLGSNLVLQPASASVTPYDTGIYYAAPIPTSRDYYRIGFGMDFYRLAKNILQKSNDGNAAKQEISKTP